MSIMRFSDGVTVDTSGELRKMHLPDGWYVVGQGMLLPMDTEQEADDFIEKETK